MGTNFPYKVQSPSSFPFLSIPPTCMFPAETIIIMFPETELLIKGHVLFYQTDKGLLVPDRVEDGKS